MLQELSLAISSVKTAVEISQAMLKTSNKIELDGKVFELQGIILSLQSSLLDAQTKYHELQEINREIKTKLTQFENWENEKSDYELKEIDTGTFVYIYKPSVQSAKKDHWFCTNCFENKCKSIIQRGDRQGITQYYFCPKCSTKIRVIDK